MSIRKGSNCVFWDKVDAIGGDYVRWNSKRQLDSLTREYTITTMKNKLTQTQDCRRQRREKASRRVSGDAVKL